MVRQNIKNQPVHPACPKCGTALSERTLFIMDYECWKCHIPLKSAVLTIGYTFYPEDFTQEELDAARQRGAVVKEQFSKTQQRQYLGNTCPSCGVLQGNWYVGEGLSDYVGVPRQEVDTGLACSGYRVGQRNSSDGLPTLPAENGSVEG